MIPTQKILNLNKLFTSLVIKANDVSRLVTKTDVTFMYSLYKCGAYIPCRRSAKEECQIYFLGNVSWPVLISNLYTMIKHTTLIRSCKISITHPCLPSVMTGRYWCVLIVDGQCNKNYTPLEPLLLTEIIIQSMPQINNCINMIYEFQLLMHILTSVAVYAIADRA